MFNDLSSSLRIQSKCRSYGDSTQGNYQYAVLDELTCSYLDFPIAQKEGLVTQYSFSEWDLFQIQPIGEHYRWSYFCVNIEHQMIVIISDCEPIVV